MSLEPRRDGAGIPPPPDFVGPTGPPQNDALIDRSISETAKHGRGRSSEADNLQVWVDDHLIHQSPPVVTRSLRYLMARGDLPGRLSLTSSLFGEGVTSMSRSLASLIAYDWREPTCWVDLNWWKSTHDAFETAPFRQTISSVVEGRGSVTNLPVATSVPGLSMVAAGEVPAGSRPRLARSETLASLLDDLSKSFAYIVCDLPPVLASSDAVTLSGLTDGFLLVVQQRSTSSIQVRGVLQAMDVVPCLGTILNGSRSSLPRWMRTSNEVWALGN